VHRGQSYRREAARGCFATTLPVLIATAVLLMLGTLTLILVADRVRRR
jgi:hypothetical protein